MLLDALGISLRSVIVDREYGDGSLAGSGRDQGLARETAVARDAGVDAYRSGQVWQQSWVVCVSDQGRYLA